MFFCSQVADYKDLKASLNIMTTEYSHMERKLSTMTEEKKSLVEQLQFAKAEILSRWPFLLFPTTIAKNILFQFEK